MNFAALDLNLLRVFDAMMIERNTGRAGARIGLSQPAVSAALNRLRDVAGDPLFVRAGNRMVPTPRAEALAEPVRTALANIEGAFAETTPFNPNLARQAFRILSSDYFSTILMPPLASIVAQEAPNVLLQMLDRGRGDPQVLLGESIVDLCVEPGWQAPDWLRSELLLMSNLVGVAASSHPAFAGLAPGDRISPELFESLRHALVSIDGDPRGTLDRVLAAQGITRRFALTLPHFHAMALAVAETDLFAALPESFARTVAPRLGLSIYKLPVSEPSLRVEMYWHSRNDLAPANLWLREKVRAAWRRVEGRLDH